MRYQFQLYDLPNNSPVRDTWEEAAQDAINAGYALPWDAESLVFFYKEGTTTQEGTIACISEEPKK